MNRRDSTESGLLQMSSLALVGYTPRKKNSEFKPLLASCYSHSSERLRDTTPRKNHYPRDLSSLQALMHASYKSQWRRYTKLYSSSRFFGCIYFADLGNRCLFWRRRSHASNAMTSNFHLVSRLKKVILRTSIKIKNT